MNNITCYYNTLNYFKPNLTLDSQLSILSHNYLPLFKNNFEESFSYQPIAANSRYGIPIAINENYFVYIGNKDKIRVISRNTGSCIETENHNTTTNELLLKENSNLLISCDQNGCIKLNDLQNTQCYNITNTNNNILYSKLKWHCFNNILFSIGNNSCIYIWNINIDNIDNIEISLPLCIQLNEEIIDISIDNYGDLYILTSSGKIYKNIINTNNITIDLIEIQLNNDNNSLDNCLYNSLFVHDNIFIIGINLNSKIYIYKQIDNNTNNIILKQIQTIECNNRNTILQEENQLSFISNYNKSFMIISNKKQKEFKLLYFNSNYKCFTHYEKYLTENNIIYHSYYFNNNTNTIDLFCHLSGKKKHTFSLLSHDIDFNKYLYFNESLELTYDNNIEINNINNIQSYKHIKEIKEIKDIKNNDIKLKKNKKSLRNTKDSKENNNKIQNNKDNKQNKKNTTSNNNNKIKEDKTNSQQQTIPEISYSPSILPKIERMITSYLDKLHHRIKIEQIEREKRMLENIKTSMISFCKKQSKEYIESNLQNTVEEFTNSVQDYVKEQIKEDNLVRTLRKELYDYFSNILGPAVETSFRSMFRQITDTFEQGIVLQFQQLQEASVNDSMQQTVEQLTDVCSLFLQESDYKVSNEIQQDIESIKEPEKTKEMIIDNLLQDGRYEEAFTNALSLNLNDNLIEHILERLAGCSDWHGSVPSKLLLDVIIYLANKISINESNITRYFSDIQDLLAHLYLDTAEYNTLGNEYYNKLSTIILPLASNKELNPYCHTIMRYAQQKLCPIIQQNMQQSYNNNNRPSNIMPFPPNPSQTTMHMGQTNIQQPLRLPMNIPNNPQIINHGNIMGSQHQSFINQNNRQQPPNQPHHFPPHFTPNPQIMNPNNIPNNRQPPPNRMPHTIMNPNNNPPPNQTINPNTSGNQRDNNLTTNPLLQLFQSNNLQQNNNPPNKPQNNKNF